MTIVVVVVAGLLVGLAGGYLLGRAGIGRRAPGAGSPGARRRVDGAGTGSLGLPATDLARRSVERMRLATVVVDPTDALVLANAAARRLGVADGESAVPVLAELVRQARRAAAPVGTEADLPHRRPRSAAGGRAAAVRAEAVPVSDAGHVVLFVEDLTESRRVDAVRRDFVANVSHELKTPVGALALLAEAICDGYDDDPPAVRRFAERMRHEATRLSRLVQELVDLSRLQGAEPQSAPQRVAVDDIVAEAVDRTRLAAETRHIAVVAGGEPGLVVLGNDKQLVTALVNLLDNAVNYSPEQTRVALAVRRTPAGVEVSVTDQGIGIAPADRERVFERFYRVDPARSRDTGGTGLGLAIVKHIASNHGGDVSVWSVEAEGSTFTLRLPEALVAGPAEEAR